MDVIDAPSPNHDERPPGGAVDMLVLHYTGMRDGGAALARLRDPAARVSAHYLIEEDGRVFRLVDEDRRAWHAGISCWAGERDINGVSIGIELVNPGHEFGYRAFPDAQMAALAELCRGLLERHPVPPARIVGHADVAPARKQDPGELFDWAALAAAGIGLWPMAVDEYAPVANVPHALSSFGYDVAGAGLSACAVAFQRHWRPARIDGAFDTECRHILAALLDAAAPSEDV
jgi:N-acetylmuramoyl-L-alanine amidase